MVYFITVLRALACCIITNSHYNNVYPLDFIANGGLAGNAIFCAVSGYCLYYVRSSFPQWYGKRLIRCYLPVWVITGVYMLLSFFTTAEQGLFASFGYPTRYHFIASIVMLYIPFFIVMKWKLLRDRLPRLLMGLAVGLLIYYIFFFDKSYWHIENVRGLPERIVLFSSMLLGAWFRQNDEQYRNRLCRWHFLLVPFLFGAYLCMSYLFSKNTPLVVFQICVPVCKLFFVYFTLRLFAGLDHWLQQLPKVIRRCIDFLATLTLEIYLVQGEIIDRVRHLFGFPLNWLALTGTILAAAFVLHLVCEGIMKLSGSLLRRLCPTTRK